MGIKSVIGVCGFGYSGSGAVLDLLKASSAIHVEDDIEFSLVYTPDGIEDLQHNISLCPSRYWSSDSAIRRFIQLIERKRKNLDYLSKGLFSVLIDKYLADIIQVKWKGSTGVHIYQESWTSFFFKQRVFRRVVSEYEKRIKPISIHVPPQKTMYYSYIDNENFINISRELVMNLLESIVGNEKSTIVLDQPFSANNPEKSFPFFENPKAIVVLRDPRDTYLLAMHNLGLMGSFVPTDNVKSFAKYYKGLMESRSISVNPNILTVFFEDLIYNYETTKQIILDFIGCKELSFTGKNLFNPDVSINNTQLWRKYEQHAEEIKYLEKELSDYLYDFSKYEKKPSFLTNSF